MFAGKRSAGFTSVVVAAAFTLSGQAQQGRQLTAADYAHAEQFMNYNLDPQVFHAVEHPAWLDASHFTFRDAAPDGATYLLVDPASKTAVPAFDHAKLAAALTAHAHGKPSFQANNLPRSNFSLANNGTTVILPKLGLTCDLSGAGVCTATPGMPPKDHEPLNISPDKSKGAFIRNWNLWIRDLKTGTETQLTTDGVKDFGYATDNAGWKHTDEAILVWSPDSKKIATFQQDQRKTGEMYLVPVTNSHPKLEAWKYPLVGDKDVTMIERVILDLDTRTVIRLKMPPDQHRSTLCDDVSCSGNGWDDVQWAPDATHLAFVSTSRDHKQEWLRVADATSGDVREVFSETAPRFFESGDNKVNWHYLPASNEFLWFSERAGWGQMYLYDLATGTLKNQITQGDGNVTQVLHVDEKTRTIYYLAVGKQPSRDPYFQHFYSIHFDGSGLTLLTPENANHEITVSPDGHYFVDVYSTPTQPQTTIVRDSSGALAMNVAKEDIGKIVAKGWKPLTPITVKGRDGKTELYGFLFKPTSFDPARKYPIVNQVYPGPQIGSCGDRNFHPAHHDMQSLAELGFVVVCIDGMGTPSRSKAFHEFYYGNLGDDTIPDQVSGIKDLAAQYPWIDLSRVGMYGHSGGGNATASAMFHFPDFFKVGISESGNHDQRDYEDDWAEKWAGLEVRFPDGTSNYDAQANQAYVKNLKGHLLLAHGTMDDNVPMNNTLLLVEALIKANKDFDLILIPNVAHGYAIGSQYMARRRWDYFVRNLAGDTPPYEYQMKPYAEVRTALGQSGPDEASE